MKKVQIFILLIIFTASSIFAQKTFVVQTKNNIQYISYFAKNGEMIDNVAKTFFINTNTLSQFNNFNSSTILKEGQEIFIPLIETNFFKTAGIHPEMKNYTAVYQMLDEDLSIADICRKYSIDINAFYKWNAINSERELKADKAIVGWVKNTLNLNTINQEMEETPVVIEPNAKEVERVKNYTETNAVKKEDEVVVKNNTKPAVNKSMQEFTQKVNNFFKPRYKEKPVEKKSTPATSKNTTVNAPNPLVTNTITDSVKKPLNKKIVDAFNKNWKKITEPIDNGSSKYTRDKVAAENAAKEKLARENAIRNNAAKNNTTPPATKTTPKSNNFNKSIKEGWTSFTKKVNTLFEKKPQVASNTKGAKNETVKKTTPISNSKKNTPITYNTPSKTQNTNERPNVRYSKSEVNEIIENEKLAEKNTAPLPTTNITTESNDVTVIPAYNEDNSAKNATKKIETKTTAIKKAQNGDPQKMVFAKNKTGKASCFYSGSTNGTFYVFTSIANKGDIIKVTNMESGKYVFAEVIGALPPVDVKTGIIIKLSDNAMLPLKLKSKNFNSKIDFK